MKIAAIQHRLRESAHADAHALAEAALVATRRGADMIIFPDVGSLELDGGAGRVLLAALLRDVPAFCIVPSVDPMRSGMGVIAELPSPVAKVVGGEGIAGMLVGDSCIDPEEIARAATQMPSLLVLSPRNETDLQAEAMLEFALQLSDSIAGVIVVAECAGSEPLEVGHGGSAIVVLGEIVAEALADDDVLVAEVASPFPQPSPREQIPPVPPLLAQRFAHHTGSLPVEHGPDVS